jgi:hypothetical protein
MEKGGEYRLNETLATYKKVWCYILPKIFLEK